MTEVGDQRKLQALVMQAQSYQGALQDIARQNALLERASMEIQATLEALEELPKSKGTDSLVPIGGGVYTKAQITDKKTVVVAIGAGIYAEKGIAEAKTFLTVRKSKIESDLKLLANQSQRISAELEKANQAAEELYMTLQK